MKIAPFLSACTLLLCSFSSLSQATAPQVSIRAELASPIVQDNSIKENYLKISLTGFALDPQKRVPINLALVIDRSSSMSGDRIEKARAAAHLAINLLNEEDTLAVVAYDSNAKVIIPATKVKDKAALIQTINKTIQAQGMTALYAGLAKGINQLERYLDKEKVNRIILLSDGQANVGPTSINELTELAQLAARKGIAITTMGIGTGYNENLMAAIAGFSDGNHAFVNHSSDLEGIFIREFKDVMSVVAQEVVVSIKLDENVKPIRLLGRDGEIKGDRVTVKMNQLYSNQEKYVLLEVLPAKGRAQQEKTLAQVSVNYDNLVSKQAEQYQAQVKIKYTDQVDLVKQSVIEEVVIDSEIQKVALENEKAMQLYNSGELSEAKQKLDDNTARLKALSMQMSNSSAVNKALEQAEINQSMAADMQTKDADRYRKEVTEQQYNLKQGNSY